MNDEQHDQLMRECDEILREISIVTYGFNVYDRFPKWKERKDFEESDEAAELRALIEAQHKQEARKRWERLTPEQREREDLETELLLLELEQSEQEYRRLTK